MDLFLTGYANRAFLLIAVFFVGLLGCQEPPPPPDPADTLRPVVEAYADVWNTGDVDRLDSLVVPSFQRHSTGTTSADGLDSLKASITNFRTAYPDFKVTLDDVIYGKDRATIRWTFTGTNTGPTNIPATGKSVQLSGASVSYFSEGMMTEEWVYSNDAAMMQQLGYTLTPPKPPARRR